MWRILLGFVCLAMVGCQSDEGKNVDLIVFGSIYSGVPDSDPYSAMAITNGVVEAMGEVEEIRELAGRQTAVLDLGKAFIMPGFNDAHLHIQNAAARNMGVDLVGVQSEIELLALVSERLNELEPSAWLFGRGWDENLWDRATIPAIAALDALSDTNPIVLRRVDGHSSIVNSVALERAGFDCDSPPPEGGVIVCDEAGNPTGWVKEAASNIVTQLIPDPSMDERLAAYEIVFDEFLANGVTSVQDDSIRGAAGGQPVIDALLALRQADRLPVRVTAWLPFNADIATLNGMRDQLGTNDPWLKAGLVKANLDGSGGSLTAAMLYPYASAPDNRGVLLYSEQQLEAMAQERVQAGFQLGLHAIGDRANRVVLNVIEAARAIPGSDSLRHRVEHAQFVNHNDARRFADLNVVASVQPSHLLSDMRWAPEVLGPEREADAYRWASLLDSGAQLAFGTDYPVEVLNPMRGLYAAVSREFEDGGPPGGWLPDEKLSIAQAIEAYTWGAAYAEHEEKQKGRLLPGMLADFVVLDTDLLNASDSEILAARVLLTATGGVVRYRADDFQ